MEMLPSLSFLTLVPPVLFAQTRLLYENKDGTGTEGGWLVWFSWFAPTWLGKTILLVFYEKKVSCMCNRAHKALRIDIPWEHPLACGGGVRRGGTEVKNYLPATDTW